MSGGSSGGYQVVYLRPVLDTVRDWLNRAGALGLRPPLDAALFAIHYRLTNDPSTWGNLDRTLPHLRMHMRKASEWGIAVHFGVDVANRLVCVNQMRLLTGHPLSPTP